MAFADEIRNLMKINNLSPEEISNLARDLANEITIEQEDEKRKEEQKKKAAARFVKSVEKTAETAKPTESTKTATADKPKSKKEIHNIGPNITVTTEKRDDGTIIYTYERKDLGKTYNPFLPFDSSISWFF